MIRPGIRALLELATGRRTDPAGEVREEVEYHLQQRTEQLVRQGLAPAEARAEAERRFGVLPDVERALRHTAGRRELRTRVRERLEAWGSDLRFAARGLRREPGFTGFVVATLALGIGTNVAVFGVADRLLLTGPTAIEEPDGLVRFHLHVTYPNGDRGTGPVRNFPAYEALRDRTRSFTGVATYSREELVVGAGPGSRMQTAGWASSDLFPVLGTRASHGRYFTPEEDSPAGGTPVVVLAHHAWVRDFGADPAAVGAPLLVDGAPYTIIGVTAPGFTGAELSPVDLWLPISLRGPRMRSDWRTSWDSFWVTVIGRLRPGVTLEQASEDATGAYRQGYTGSRTWMAEGTIRAVPNRYTSAGRERAEARVARWLMGTAALVLLIACANVINLLLARMVRRRREVAVRLALGAGRGRLIRLLLAESGLLAVAAGAASLAVAALLGGFIWRVILPDLAATRPPVGFAGLLATLGITALTGLVIGVWPALRSSRQDLTPALKSGSNQAGTTRSRARATLTVTQAALSVVLLAGAGLFVRSVWTVTRIDLGLEPDRVLVADVRYPLLPLTAGVEDRRAEALRQKRVDEALLVAASLLPDVEAAALAVGLPYHSSFGVALRVPGLDSIPSLPGGGPYISAVTAGYFATIGTPILAGRPFTATDRAGSEPVVIVNQLMADLLWPGQPAIGQCLIIGEEASTCSRVVGVAADVHKDGFREEPSMQYYVPRGQERGFSGSALLIRPREGLQSATEPLRRRLQAVDGSIVHIGFQSLQESLDPQLRPWRLGAALFGVCGVLALLVTAVGLYSVLAYLVTDRTHEIGVRLALGASAGDVSGMVARGGLALAGTGALLGLALAIAGGGWIEPLLFETSGRDPVVLVGVALLILLVAVVASMVPAWRAARVSPMTALRAE